MNREGNVSWTSCISEHSQPAIRQKSTVNTEQNCYGRLAPAYLKLAIIRAISIVDKEESARDVYCLRTSDDSQSKEYQKFVGKNHKWPPAPVH